jgi:hypothetical protein
VERNRHHCVAYYEHIGEPDSVVIYLSLNDSVSAIGVHSAEFVVELVFFVCVGEADFLVSEQVYPDSKIGESNVVHGIVLIVINRDAHIPIVQVEVVQRHSEDSTLEDVPVAIVDQSDSEVSSVPE